MNGVESRHVSVLLNEAINALEAQRTGMFLDCTLGGGGHTRAILQANPSNRVVALDRDANAITRFGETERVTVVRAKFSEAQEVLAGAKFNGILADLGVSTDQLWENRGFSFRDQVLDMRMGEGDITAATLVNELDKAELFKILKEGGVGNEAKAAVSAIIKERPILSAEQLSAVISNAIGDQNKKDRNPATVVFQALRIRVNDELNEIRKLLDSLPSLALPGARAALITFHSLEDRIVTKQLRTWAQGGEFSASFPGAKPGKVLGELMPGPILPSTEEVKENPASRSARLRVFRFY